MKRKTFRDQLRELAQPTAPRDPAREARDRAFAEGEEHVRGEIGQVLRAADRVGCAQSDAVQLYGETDLDTALRALERWGSSALESQRMDALATEVHASRNAQSAARRAPEVRGA